MPYTETHEITIGPITLPQGVSVAVSTQPATGGLQAVTISGVTATSKDDTAALLLQAFALLMTAAAGEGVGQPVFTAAPAPAPAPAPAVDAPAVIG